MKRLLHIAVLGLERVFDRFFRRPKPGRVIEPYMGYATSSGLIVRGRVLSSVKRNSPVEHQSRWTNFKQILALFLTDEVAGVSVKTETRNSVTDEEGYFSIEVPKGLEAGWQAVDVWVEAETDKVSCPVLVPHPDARFLVISDIDDTVLETGAYVLWRNLWTSLTGNSLTRHVFPDAIEMMDRLSAEGRNPVYFVSSSPWNFHYFLSEIFERNSLVRGPMFLRDLGVGEKQFITGTHHDHKSSSIDKILEANPDLPAILVGDTGQHDAEVYRDAIARHPGRIASVLLREPGPGPKAAARAAMDDLRESGVPLMHGSDFSGMMPEKMVA